MPQSKLLALLGLCLATIAGLRPLSDPPEGLASDTADPPVEVREIRFNRDIRPILSDRCFACHGFDAAQRKADLRLDTREGLTADLGGMHPVVPGKPELSELIARIEETDPEFVMPPPDSGLVLTSEERALLREWVQQGAPFEDHWAFVPPATEIVPPVVEGAPADQHPIDAFITRRLVTAGLEASPLADRATLARRASLDLRGLPATPEEIDAFLADDRPDAWERLLDQFMASPQFGERMALEWLDAARYADTNGFHHDNLRTSWPWRDWVIDAFNADMPFDRFLIEQVAGDLLPDATPEQVLATAFCRMHNINDEGGALDEEYRVEAIADRIETIATVFMGLTFNCARCHDHKYDPLTQDDYYGLYAYFNSVEERGVYPLDRVQSRAYPARLAVTPPDVAEAIARASAELERTESELEASRSEVAADLVRWEAARREEAGIHWLDVVWNTPDLSKLSRGAQGTWIATGPVPDRATYELTTTISRDDLSLLALHVPASPGSDRPGRAHNGNAVISAVEAWIEPLDGSAPSAVRWSHAWADHEQANGDFDAHNLVAGTGEGWALDGHRRTGGRVLLLRATEGFGHAGPARLRVRVKQESRYAKHVIGRLRLQLAAGDTAIARDLPTREGPILVTQRVKGASFDALFDEVQGLEGVKTLEEAGARKLAPAAREDLVEGAVYALSGERSSWFFVRTFDAPTARKLRLGFGSDDGLKVWWNGEEALSRRVRRGAAPDQDELIVEARAGRNLLVAEVVNDGGPGGFWHRADEVDASRAFPLALLRPDDRSAADTERLLEAWAPARSPRFIERLEARREATAALSRARSGVVQVSVMKERAMPVQAHVLVRGHYASPDLDRPARRGPPAFLAGAMPDGPPKDRLGLARWLARPDHPLTARVRVNRIWQTIFGRGIVATSENFGVQASWPSHPELLDWLARRFADDGWSTKRLLKRIMTSETYRRSSRQTADQQERDPDQKLLAAFPRQRLQAELLRDLVLDVSGLLVRRIGGPSVKPYQPEGLWREVSIGASSNTRIFERDDGEALWRRSLYTFWKRTSPNPQMLAFDAPTREFCVVERGTTNTPLQALVTWNDEQFLEASRVLAQRALEAEGSDEERLSRLFRRITGRTPDREDTQILSRLLTDLRTRFADDVEGATALLAAGESARPMTLAVTELAPWTLVASAVLGLDETIVKD